MQHSRLNKSDNTVRIISINRHCNKTQKLSELYFQSTNSLYFMLLSCTVPRNGHNFYMWERKLEKGETTNRIPFQNINWIVLRLTRERSLQLNILSGHQSRFKLAICVFSPCLQVFNSPSSWISLSPGCTISCMLPNIHVTHTRAHTPHRCAHRCTQTPLCELSAEMFWRSDIDKH